MGEKLLNVVIRCNKVQLRSLADMWGNMIWAWANECSTVGDIAFEFCQTGGSASGIAHFWIEILFLRREGAESCHVVALQRYFRLQDYIEHDGRRMP